MAVSLEDFKANIIPDETNTIRFYVSGSAPNEEVLAMNIAFDDLNGVNLYSTLNKLETITLQPFLDITSQTFTVNDIEEFPTHFHISITPVDIGQYIDTNGGSYAMDLDLPITTTSFLIPPPGDAEFDKSEYQAILNNTEADRSSTFILDVDRKNSSIIPSNYEAIISGTASPAAYQELNYSSIGLRNSRYDGAKTSKTSFGVSPAIAGTTFEAASYLSSSTDDFVCSQSFSDRNLNTFIFTGTDEIPLSGSSIFQFNNNQIIPVRNRRLWVRENEKVIYVNQQGEATSDGFSCVV